VEKNGVDLFPGFPGAELLYEGTRVVGVRTRDQGIDKEGNQKPNYQPGINIKAKVTILGEGPRGTLTKQLIRKFNLNEGRDPDVYSLGIKEIWELPKGSLEGGRVTHTMGYPLKSETFGGGFIYNMADDYLDIGFVVGLDYKDPYLDPHHEFQKFKTHPYIQSLLKGGKMVEYGAKTIPEGGYYSIPKLYTEGCILIGDSANLLNPMRLKGIHMAMKSGMLAAETVYQALKKNEFSEKTLSQYEELVHKSWIYKELYRVRNFHQGFRNGMWMGLLNSTLMLLTRGRGLWERLNVRPGHLEMLKINEYYGNPAPEEEDMVYDDKLTFTKVRDIYSSETMHEENQPSHLQIADFNICNNRCTTEYGNPCRHFCPASVYEMVEKEDGKGKHLQINASNCIHCKTCDIMDPYGIITWVPPEGGGGPGYKKL
jgi:electron-transferring-flavoprotein dehydrogenase